MELTLIRRPDGSLAPYGDDSIQQAQKIKAGRLVHAKITQPRNPLFHRKLFALFGLIFDIWSETIPPREYKGEPVQRSRERLRKDVIILAGYYEPVYCVNSELRLEAKSIAFGSMSELEFETFYSAVIDVALQKIFKPGTFTEETLRAHVERILSFD